MDYPEQYPVLDSLCLYLPVLSFLILRLLVHLPFPIFLLIIFVSFLLLPFEVVLLRLSVEVSPLPPFSFELLQLVVSQLALLAFSPLLHIA